MRETHGRQRRLVFDVERGGACGKKCPKAVTET